jgi:hypothetical protein
VGPVRLLTRLRPAYVDAISESEQFGVFLWLRTLDRANKKKYSLTLVGSSFCAHLEPWSGRREEPITGDSICAAVRAVYVGNVPMENLGSEASSDVWNGVVAVPMVMNKWRSTRQLGPDALDTLVIGAISLQTTKLVDAADHPADELSVISQLKPDEFQSLVDSLSYVASRALSPG